MARPAAGKVKGVRQRHGNGCEQPAKGCACPWQAEVFSKRDGKKIRKLFGSRKAAEEWRRDALPAVARDELRGPSRITVREAAGAFMAGAKAGTVPTTSGARYKPATLRGYRVALDKRILPALGDRRLSEVRRRDVQDLADRLTVEGLSASTVHNTLDPLRVIFRRAIQREEGVTVDPTKLLELRRPTGRRERIAEPAEAAALISTAPVGERALWATAFYAGLRRGELRALRWSDVDLPGRLIHVRRSWDAIEGEQTPKSEAGVRDVPVLDRLAGELEAHQKRTRRTGKALVFGRTASEPFNPETVRRNALAAWEAENERRRKAREELLEPIQLHEARHTCASTHIAAGANALTIKTIMGHSTIQMTFDVYGKLLPGGLEQAAAATNAYLERLDGRRGLRVVS